MSSSLIVTRHPTPSSPRKNWLSQDRPTIYNIYLPFNEDLSPGESVLQFLSIPAIARIEPTARWDQIQSYDTVRFHRLNSLGTYTHIGQTKKGMMRSLLEKLNRPSRRSMYSGIKLVRQTY